jgi:hypothetical protein
MPNGYNFISTSHTHGKNYSFSISIFNVETRRGEDKNSEVVIYKEKAASLLN